MAGSFQSEIPAARINLKLDVGKGGAKKKMELPLKMLVVGDFSFAKRSSRIAERERISITRDNFAQVMESMGLKLSYQVDNKLTGQGAIDVKLDIKNMDSFRPEHVAKSVPELARLLAARNLLRDLKSNLLDNREFRKRLEELLSDPEAAKALHAELSKLVLTQSPAHAS